MNCKICHSEGRTLVAECVVFFTQFGRGFAVVTCFFHGMYLKTRHFKYQAKTCLLPSTSS